MKHNHLQNIQKEYRILYGEKGKKYYSLTQDFWDYIQKLLQDKVFDTKRDLAKHISDLTKNKINQKSIEGWFYTDKRPIIVEKFAEPKNNLNLCNHGFSFFCISCNLNEDYMKQCSVPLFWKTHDKGKLYVYEKYWKDLKANIDNHEKYGHLLSSFYNKLNIGQRQIRRWKANKGYPKLFTDDEFSFSKHNLYLLGLFLSDGHIRKNGSHLSFTYQSGSSNVFQGYWYPQFIQRMLPIFKNKQKLSNTYLKIDKTYEKTVFVTNLSSISPIFIKKIEKYGLIEKRNSSVISGYKKRISSDFLKEIDSYTEYFQGLYDGDGAYWSKSSPLFDLSTSPDIDYSEMIKMTELVPTLTTHDKKKFIPYHNRSNNSLYLVRFAPSSLKHISDKDKPEKIVKQINFFIDSAFNSIRPDKVYKLIEIINLITSKKYGKYRNCHLFQSEIRDLSKNYGFKQKLDLLKKQYPIKKNNYQPFLPIWAKALCSKDEAWDFFNNKENLVFRNNNVLINLDFSKGIPIDLDYSDLG